MPPKEELLIPFENVSTFWCRRKKVSLGWRRIGHRLFARPHNAERELVWSCPMFTPPVGEEQQHITQYLESGYPVYFFNRYVSLTYKQDEVWLLPYLSSACGLVRPNSNNRTNWNWNFAWKGDYPSLIMAPTELFLQQANRAIESDREAWIRVMQWSLWNQDERFWSCVSWKSGDKEEWQTLVRALLRLILWRLPSKPSCRWPVFKFRRPRFAFAPLRMTRSPQQHDFPPVTWTLLELTERYFGALVDYRPTIESGIRPYSNEFSPRPIIVQDSSQHELMEAINLWREFGCKSGQSPQVESCLQQLLI